MAITENRRMQQLRGKYADLDKSKMLVGEIAIPSDHSPILKVDTDKYIELVSSEDTEYIEKITKDLNNALSDVNQLAIDKVGINNAVESDVQTYSSRKIQAMHNKQAQEIANQFKVLTGAEVVANDSSKGFATSIEIEGKNKQNGIPTPSTPIAIMNSGECVELQQGVYQTNSGALSTSGVTTYLCNKYPIPCKSGDTLAISVELSTIKGVHFLFYNESGYISYSTVYSTSGTVTVPSGATYFNIDVVGADGVEITTETVGKVELTINGKYVLQIKSVGTNAESVATILLNEPLRAANDVKDVIEYVNDGYKVRRKIGSEVVTQYENSVALTNCMRLKLPLNTRGIVANANQMCNMAIQEVAYSKDYEHFYLVDYAMYLFVKKETCGTTDDEIKTWLANTHIEVQYELPTEVIEDIADQTPFYNILTYDGGTTISTTDRLQPTIEVEYPTNRVSGVASEGYTKAAALTDKFLTYQFRDIPGETGIGALCLIELPNGVDAKNCTVLVSHCATDEKYNELTYNSSWDYNLTNVNIIASLGNNGEGKYISVYIKNAEKGKYAHVNVTVIRNDI